MHIIEHSSALQLEIAIFIDTNMYSGYFPLAPRHCLGAEENVLISILGKLWPGDASSSQPARNSSCTYHIENPSFADELGGYGASGLCFLRTRGCNFHKSI